MAKEKQTRNSNPNSDSKACPPISSHCFFFTCTHWPQKKEWDLNSQFHSQGIKIVDTEVFPQEGDGRSERERSSFERLMGREHTGFSRCLKVEAVFDLVVGLERRELGRPAATKDKLVCPSLCLQRILHICCLWFYIHSVRNMLTLWQRSKLCRKKADIFVKETDFGFLETKLQILPLTWISNMALGIIFLTCKTGIVIWTSVY